MYRSSNLFHYKKFKPTVIKISVNKMKTDSPNLDARQVENQNKAKRVLFSIKFSGLGYRSPWPFI